MALVQRTINQCDICGYEWIPRSTGERCGNRTCRSTKWNESSFAGQAGKSASLERDKSSPLKGFPVHPGVSQSAGDNLKAQLEASIAGIMANSGICPGAVDAAEGHGHVERPMCSYTEWVDGEQIRCGLTVHSAKIKHTRGDRV